MNIQRIHTPSGEELVVLSAADFERLVADHEDRADIEDARAAMVELKAEGGVPSDVLKEILDGMHPLIAWRQHRKMSQAELAKLAGVTQAAVARLELTEAGAGRLPTRQALAKALGAPLSSLGG